MYNKYCTPFVAHVPYLTDDEVDVVLDEGVQAPPEVPLYLALVVRVPPGQVTGLGDPTSTVYSTTSNKIRENTNSSVHCTKIQYQQQCALKENTVPTVV